MRVLVCAGGTGGHIYPALAPVTQLRDDGLPTDHILWVGAKGKMEEQLVPREGLRLETFLGGAIVGVSIQQAMLNVAKLAWSVPLAYRMIRRFRPDVMFMTGGYTAVPATLAARMAGVPVVIFLPDVEPGKAISAVMRFAEKIACTADGSKVFVPEEKMVVTGYPVRPEIRAAKQLSKAEALAQFDLTPERKTLFVFGGSRGAQAINRALMGVLPELLKTIQVIHISGTLTWSEVEANLATLSEEQRAYYRPFSYLHERMGAAFRAADLCLARAGASMMGESPAFGLPTILVPLTFAWRYQKVNADFLTERGAAVQSTDEALPQEITDLVLGLMRDEEKLAKMASAAQALDRADAVEALTAVIWQASGKGKNGND